MMSKKKTNDLLIRITKGVYRKAPKSIKRSIKNVIVSSSLKDSLSTTSQSTNPQPRVAAKVRTRIPMSWEDIGTTYDRDEVLPMLAVENNALHTLLRNCRRELRVSQERLAETSDFNRGPEDEEGYNQSAAALANRYLAGQPHGTPRHLVIANEYPRVGREYGNGFVHQRVKQYLSSGVAVDVVCAGYSVDQELYEYDGVRVLTGHGQEIAEILKRQTYTSVSVHFLNRLMWEALKPFLADLDIHIFLHGYECSRWVRQLSNYNSGRDLERAIERSINLQEFWHEVLYHSHQPKSYIFVSDWWRQAVYDDMRLTFPANRVHIIHNYINTKLFDYVAKPDDQRFNLLWIRSASNRKYGNDIAIKVLKQLSKSEYWERCKVTILGEGRYFSEFQKELGAFPNVHIEERFISQDEIAALHKTHGVFLVPSRLDSQGVSRDEAMSSGLVPVTNLVTAIPEFVDSDTGIVAEPENSEQLAAGILSLWEDAEKFQRLSKAAAQRVRHQSGREATIDREIEVLGIEG